MIKSNKYVFRLIILATAFGLTKTAFCINLPIYKNINFTALNEYFISNNNPINNETSIKNLKSYQFSEVDKLIKNASSNYLVEEDGMEDIWKISEDYAGNPKVQKAKMAIASLNSSNLISLLTGTELTKLPVGIKHNIDGYTYTIVFSRAKLFADHAEIQVYGGIEKEGEVGLFFGADDIKFSYEGGIIGDATLGLFADYPIKRDSKKIAFLFHGFKKDNNGNNKEGTYITFDCNGFREARIDGNVIISREWIVPTDSNGVIIKDSQKRVTTHLALTVMDLNDFIVEASIPYFTLSQDTSITFAVDKATIDFSDSKNAPNFISPPEFNAENGELSQINADIETKNLWKGIYFEKLEIILPTIFKQDDQNLKVGAENLFIDSKGVTGKFYIENILTLDRGKLGNTGWAFSMENIEMDLIYNRVFGFGFAGQIVIPISDDQHPLRYGALANLATETYNFNIAIDSIMTIPMWDVVSVALKTGTKLNIAVEDGNFKAQAILCGNMAISLKPKEENKNTSLSIADIVFDKIIVNSYVPYVSLDSIGGHISFHSGPVLNNSFLNVDHATLTSYEGDKVMFTLGMEAGIMSEKDGGAKTGGTFGMVGKPILEGGRQKWEFDEMKLISLEIHLDFANAGYIKGGITFFSEDPIYGNGFYGYLDGGFVKTGGKYKFTAVANARFGTKYPNTVEEYKYWNFDVYVSFGDVPITLYPPIAANGFGGGMYHHMKMSGYELNAMIEGGPTNPYSGISYEPDNHIGLGLKATVGLTTTSGKAFQGVVTLELAFTDKLALAEILMYGTGEIAGAEGIGIENKQKLSLSNNVKSQELAVSDNESEALKTKTNTITCAVFLRISLQDGFEMHGSFKAFLDAAEGIVQGEGLIDFLVSERTKNWHLYLGGYADRSITNIEGQVVPPVNVKIHFKSFQMGAEVYLMMGNDIPGPPPINTEVASYFGIPITTNNRDNLNNGGRSAANGTAAAFGASAYLNFKYIETPKRFINIKALAGFDLCLLNNSELSRCGLSNTSPQGQKGWRSLGQLFAYASIEGKWKKGGINWTIPKQFIGISAQADLPNPDFFEVRVKAKLFDWLTIDQQVEIGEKCGEVIN